MDFESEKSLVDYVLEINESFDDREGLRGIVLGEFYQNIPIHISRKMKNTLNEFFFSSKDDTAWKCGHNGCKANSCQSHEISENIFIKNIAKPGSQVVILKRDMKQNPTSYVEGIIHKRNASNFRGYCEYHDQNLFSDIENGSQEINDYFVNKQCLRTLRRDQFETERNIISIRKFIDSIEEELLEYEEIHEIRKMFESKELILIAKLKRLNEVYEKIYCGINTKKYYVKHKVLEFASLGYLFGMTIDFTSDEDESPCVMFMHKLDFDSGPKVILSSLDNDISNDFLNDVFCNFKCFFVDLIYDFKDRVIFSKEFLEKINDFEKSVIYKDPSFYGSGLATKCILHNILFD